MFAVVGDRLRLDWLHDRIVELPRADRWDALARNALREDVAGEHRAVASRVLARADAGTDPDAAFDALGRRPAGRRRPHHAILDDIATQGVFDLATLSVALRELRALPDPMRRDHTPCGLRRIAR